MERLGERGRGEPGLQRGVLGVEHDQAVGLRAQCVAAIADLHDRCFFTASLAHWLSDWERGRDREYARLSDAAWKQRVQLYVAVFHMLTHEQREVVMLYFKPHAAHPGERIIHKGDKADAAYFLSSGEVEVDLERRRIKLHPGDVFGEMALISGQPRSANVTALDYCTLLKLTTSDFREIMRRYPEVRTPLAELAASRSAMNREQPSGDAAPPDPRDAPTA